VGKPPVNQGGEAALSKESAARALSPSREDHLDNLGIIGGIYRLAGPSPDLMLFPTSPIRYEILPPNSGNTTTPKIKRSQKPEAEAKQKALS